MGDPADDARRAALIMIREGIFLTRRKDIVFFHPKAEDFPQIAGIASRDDQVVFVRHAGEASGGKGPALFGEALHRCRKAFVCHVLERGCDQTVRCKVVVRTDQIHGDIEIKKCPVPAFRFLQHVQVDARPGGKLHSPPVFPVKENRGLRTGYGSFDL